MSIYVQSHHKLKEKIIITLITILIFIATQKTLVHAGVPAPYFSAPADQKLVDAAENYLKQKFGEGYYAKFIKFEGGGSYRRVKDSPLESSISFSFISPLQNKSFRMDVWVHENASIAKYYGPTKQYNFLISREESIEKAKIISKQYTTGVYQLDNIADSELIRYTMDSGFEYDITWVVRSNKSLGCEEYSVATTCSYQAIYLDVDTGEHKVGSPNFIGVTEYHNSSDTITKNKTISLSLVIFIIAFTVILTAVFSKMWSKMKRSAHAN